MNLPVGQTSTAHDGIVIRRAESADLDRIVAVCGSALGWDAGDPNEAFFRWKHLDNPFGPSPMWVAEEDSTIVGVRAMMRWRLRGPSGGALDLVRAVDTATLPSQQGKGIFRRLTMVAVEEMTAEGVDAVFNTPNDKSRPGYLKMGWLQMGRVAIGARPASMAAVRKMARSRVPADKWGTPSTFGLDPGVAFDDPALEPLCRRSARRGGWSTDASLDYHRWRYGLRALNYRIVPLGDSLAEGFVVCRVRQRGPLRELTLDDVVLSERHRRPRLADVLHEAGADAILAARATVGTAEGFVPLPRLGPILTWRPLARPGPAPSPLHLSLGAIEPF